MGFSLVPLLILLFAQRGETRPNYLCLKECPSGHYKIGDCDHDGGKQRCKECERHTYTNIPNNHTECLRCTSCVGITKEIEACTSTSNAKCQCVDGYYDVSEHSNSLHCLACSSPFCIECGSNANGKECSQCQSEHCPPNANIRKHVRNSTESPVASVTSTMSSGTADPAVGEAEFSPWILVVMATCGFLLLVFFIHGLRFRCQRVNKSLIQPSMETSGPLSLPENSPTTLTLTASETSPMMTLCSPSNEDAAVSEHKTSRQEASLENLPPKVLYAIIEEVPLRRWKQFMRLLSVTDQQMDRVELEAGLGLDYTEKQYQMLKIWNQISSAKLEDIFSVLHHMALSGCAERLEERLIKIQWTKTHQTELVTIC